MRKISAHLILDGRGKCYSKGVLSLDSDGTILEILDTGGQLTESEGVEFYSGMIVPGFVNSHCHLELSHLSGTYQEASGFVPFLKSVVEKRNFDEATILEAAGKTDFLMYKNGIVAVGDIANGPSVFAIKKNSRITYHTFVEALGFAPHRAQKSFEWAEICLERAMDSGLKASIVPHAPYSVSKELFRKIAEVSSKKDTIQSIHSQESESEDELFLHGTGDMMQHLEKNLAIDTSDFVPTGKRAIHQTLQFIPKQNNLLLVHNLFILQEDIDSIKKVRELNNTWFVICPGSNLFIQNRLPDVSLLRENGLQIAIGTDSLASNHQLSILEELRIIQVAYPAIPMEELIGWACFQGAKALKIDDWAGSIEVGKRPGINLLTGMNLETKNILPGTQIKKLC